MPVAEYVVHPGFHAEEDLAHNPELLHVVAVDGDIAGTSWHDMEPTHVFLKLNLDDYASFGCDTFR
jgi:hypothetical protein